MTESALHQNPLRFSGQDAHLHRQGPSPCQISPHTESNAAARFFDHYLLCLERAGVAERSRRWYVRRGEEFIKAQNGRKIKQLTAADLHAYFERLGRDRRLQGWQFAQCIQALRILYCEQLHTDVCAEVDWAYWLASARELETDHPTTARQLSPEELTFLKERRGAGPLQQTRLRHRDLLVRLASEIRRRGYSYRTEQTYERWVCRYLLFCGNTATDGAGAAEVRAFLEYRARISHRDPGCWRRTRVSGRCSGTKVVAVATT